MYTQNNYEKIYLIKQYNIRSKMQIIVCQYIYSRVATRNYKLASTLKARKQCVSSRCKVECIS